LQGICTNDPQNCSLAASGKRIPMHGPETTCPECGAPLRGEAHANRFSVRRSTIEVLIPVFGVTLVAFSIFLAFSHHTHLDVEPSPASNSAAHEHFFLRVSGPPELTSRLAPQLLSAWLTARGGVEIGPRALTDPKSSLQVIQARLPDAPVAVALTAAESGASFADLAASNTDIVFAARPISEQEERRGVLLGHADGHVIGAVPAPKSDPSTAPAPIYLYAAVLEGNPTADSFIAFAASGAGQKIVENAGFLPLKSQRPRTKR
jgi:hypothetical protein